MNRPRTRCPEAVYGQHDPGKDGRCLWCKAQVAYAWPKPKFFGFKSDRTALDKAYSYYYDPDFGSKNEDSY